MTKLYKLLTGPDQGADFCHKVSKSLSEGWVLHGSPTLAHDPQTGQMICAQAVTKDVEEAYDPQKTLSDHR